MIDFKCFAISKQGGSYNANEDFVEVNGMLGVFVVADGMGGRPGGAQASKFAVETFVEKLQSFSPSARITDSNLREAIAIVNKAVRNLADTDSMLTGLGTTLSAVVLLKGKGKTIHVGDSRIYLFRKNKLTQLTRDHTLVAELVERNHLTIEKAKRYPLRNVLSRSIGTQEAVEPDIGDIEVHPNDWVILATDGLSKVLEKEQLQALIRSHQSEIPEKLCKAIICMAMENQSQDNVTVAVVKVQDVRQAD